MKQKPVHILGICGTFMAGIARIAEQLGFSVAGSDAAVYPPMSVQLEAMGIQLYEGFHTESLAAGVSELIIGNAMSRGNPCVEYALNEGLPYISAPQWLAEHVLHQRYVIAVSGTHGKTTTTALLTWILRHANMPVGYLIGGVAKGFEYSADLGAAPYFVIEADEYDSAFFDKRPKFMHYRPQVLLFNNLEFDHADIYDDLEAIKKQFHYLLCTVPANGLIVHPFEDDAVQEVLSRGVYSDVQSWGLGCGDWQAHNACRDGSEFEIFHHDAFVTNIHSPLIGEHNIKNTLSAFMAAMRLGLTPSQISTAIADFPGVKRRMEHIGTINDIVVYDDFAHHPTAIATTLAGKKAGLAPGARLIAVLECASFTMKQGVHATSMVAALASADACYLLRPDQDWGIDALLQDTQNLLITDTVDHLLTVLLHDLKPQDQVVIMSNRSFGGLHKKLLTGLHQATAPAAKPDAHAH